ncbi:MAG: PIN domain-containing protein, partial [bacterium]
MHHGRQDGTGESDKDSQRPLQTIPRSAAHDDSDQTVRTFVLDTNVILHNPDAIFVFKEHHVVIPYMVIEELDKMKRKDDDLGRNARACIRHLDRLREIGRLNEGVEWGRLPLQPRAGMAVGPGGRTGTIRIDVHDYERPPAISAEAPDNHIIAVAWNLKQKGVPVVFVTKDLSARIKSDTLGIRTEDFQNQKVDADRLYTGYISVVTEGALIDELYRDRLLSLDRIAEMLTAVTEDGETYQRELLANQYIVMKDRDDENHTGLARRLGDTDHVIPVTPPRKPTTGIMARNVQQ